MGTHPGRRGARRAPRAGGGSGGPAPAPKDGGTRRGARKDRIGDFVVPELPLVVHCDEGYV